MILNVDTFKPKLSGFQRGKKYKMTNFELNNDTGVLKLFR